LGKVNLRRTITTITEDYLSEKISKWWEMEENVLINASCPANAGIGGFQWANLRANESVIFLWQEDVLLPLFILQRLKMR